MRRRRSYYLWPFMILLIMLLVRLWELREGSPRLPADRTPPAHRLPDPSTSGRDESTGRWLEGRVRHVFDGDTLELVTPEGSWRVRLKGIDAPEYDQPYGQRAREALTQLCDGQAVRVWASGQDRYDRLLGDVYCGTLWINGEMVSSGHAWHYRRGRQAPILSELERDARRAGVGLWSQSRPTAPWDHRQQTPRNGTPAESSR